MKFEVIDGADVPEQRGRKAGVRNPDAERKSAAIAEIVQAVKAGEDLIASVEAAKSRNGWVVENDTILRRVRPLIGT